MVTNRMFNSVKILSGHAEAYPEREPLQLLLPQLLYQAER